MNTQLMTRFGVAALLPMMTFASAFAAEPIVGTYKVDRDHSKVGFEISHLVVSTVEGKFSDFEGQFTLGKKPTDLAVNATINTASIDTDTKKRDDHLKSPDFFDAAKYPKITFKSKKVTGSFDKLKIVGDLTIKGKTKEVTLDGKYTGSIKDPWGNERAAFKASGQINRQDFGLAWGQVMEAGPVVGDLVTINLQVEGVQQK